MTNLAVAIRLTADGSAFVGEIKLSRDALTGLTDAANDAGQALDRAGGSGNVAELDVWRRSMQAAAEDLSRTSRGLREFQQALEATAGGLRAGRTEVETTGRGTVTALEQVRRAYDPVYAAAARYRDELRAVLQALNDNNVQGGERIRILRAVAEAHNPVIQANRQEAASLQLLADRLEPAAAATRRLAEEQALLDRALRAGRIDAESHGRLTVALKEQTAAARGTAGATRLAAHEMTNLSYQVQDAAVQLAGGQNPFLILMQQGPQAVGAVGGVGRALSLLLTPMTGVVAGAAALAGAFGLVVSRAVSIQAELRGWNVALQATGQQAGVTAAEIRGITEEMVRLGASRDDAVAALSAALDTRKLGSADQLREIGRLAVDLGVRLGGTAEAGQKLSEWLTTGTAGLRALSQATGALTVEQYAAAKAALEQGDRLKANAIVIDALKQRFQGLRQESLGPVQQAMERLNREFNAFVDVAAKASAPIVISVSVTGAEWLKGFMEFLNNPTPQAFARWQMMGNPLWGMTGTSLPPTEPRAPSPSVGSPFTGRPTAAGTSYGRYGTSITGLSNDEAIALAEITDANDRLAEAYRKVGAAREVAVAWAQAYNTALNAGKSGTLAKAEADEAARMASVQASAALADQTAQLSLQSRAALDAAGIWMSAVRPMDGAMRSTAAAMADVIVVQARAQARSEALASGLDAEARARQIVTDAAAEQATGAARTIALMNAESGWLETVAAATRDGTAARSEAERQAEVARDTMELRAAALAAERVGATDLAASLYRLIDAYDAASRRREKARTDDGLAKARRQADEEIGLLRLELSLQGEGEGVRERTLALARAELDLRRQFPTATEAEIQALLDKQAVIFDTRREIEQQRALWDELGGFVSNAFDTIGNAITEAFATGEMAAIDWGGVTKAVISEAIQLAMRLAVINPISNWMTGGNLPSLWSMAAPAAANQNAQTVTIGGQTYVPANQNAGGGTGGLSLSSLSRLTDPTALPSWWSSPIFASTPTGVMAGTAGAGAASNAGYLTAGRGATGNAGGAVGGVNNGGVTWGQAATAAGTALSAFSAFQAFSKGQIGSGIGNTIAAGVGIAQLAGVALGPLGPIAMIAAPIIGSLLDGLFAKKPSNKEAGYIWDFAADKGRVESQTGKKAPDADSQRASTDATLAIRDMGERLAALAGGKLSGSIFFGRGGRDPIRVQYNGEEARFDNSEDGAKEAAGWFAKKFAQELKPSFEEHVRTAIDRIDFSDLEEGFRQLQFAMDFKDTVQQLAGGYGIENAARKQAKEAMRQTTDAFQELLDTTEKLWPSVQQGGRTVTTTTREQVSMSAAEAIRDGLIKRESVYLGDATWETRYTDLEGQIVNVTDDLSQAVTVWREVTKTVTEGGQTVASAETARAKAAIRSRVDMMVAGTPEKTYTAGESAVAAAKARWELATVKPLLELAGYVGDELPRLAAEGMANELAGLRRDFDAGAYTRRLAQGGIDLSAPAGVAAQFATALRDITALFDDAGAAAPRVAAAVDEMTRALLASAGIAVAPVSALSGSVTDFVSLLGLSSDALGPVTAALSDVQATALTGGDAQAAYQRSLAALVAEHRAGRLEADDFAAAVGRITVQLREAMAVQAAQRQARVALRGITDPGYQPTGAERLALAGLAGPAAATVTAALEPVWTALRAGADAGAASHRALDALDAALRGGALSLADYTTAVSLLTDAAAAGANLALRAADARTGGIASRVDAIRRQGAADSAIDPGRALTVARAALDDTFAGLPLDRLRALRLEFAGMPEVLAAVARAIAAATASARSDLELRSADARTGGIASRVDAIRRQAGADAQLDLPGALTVARAALDDVFGGLPLDRLQALRREFQGMPEVISAIERAIGSVGEAVQEEARAELLRQRQDARAAYVSALQAEADGLRAASREMRELGQALRALPSSLALDRELSPEAPGGRLAEARRQLMDAAGRARSGDAEALRLVQQLVPEFLRASRDYNSSAVEYGSDYAWATGLATELGGLADTVAAQRDEQARLVDRQITAMGGVTRGLDSTVDALTALRRATDDAAAVWRGLEAAGRETVRDPGLDIIRAAAGQSGHSFSGQFRDNQFGAFSLQQMAGSSQRWGDWDQSTDQVVSKMLAVVTGYAGDFRDGQFVRWVQTNAVNEVQREAAREILRRNGHVPGFAAGGDYAGGYVHMVGEVGPELRAGAAARYWSAEQTRQILRPQPLPDLAPLVRASNDNASRIVVAIEATGARTVSAIMELAAEVARQGERIEELAREQRDLVRVVSRLAA